MSKNRPRPKTIAPRRLTREEKKARDLLVVLYDDDRPRTRGECLGVERPCPYVSCSHHLYLDVNPDTGSLRLTFPHLEVHELAETCTLDVAQQEGATLEQVGEWLNLTRERIRQIEVRALMKLKKASPEDVEL